MNVIDWMKKNAVVLAADRPDCWDEAGALDFLSRAYDALANSEGPGTYGTAGFMLIKSIPDVGVTEYTVVRQISSLNFFEEEEGPSTFNWCDSSQNMRVLVDLPDEF